MISRSAASGPGAFLARWVLLGAVVLGVVAMHHVAAPGGAMADGPIGDVSMAGASMGHVAEAHAAVESAAAGAAALEAVAPAGMDGAMHSMLHLCLAVLLAMAGLLLLVMLVWRAGRPVIAGRSGNVGAARPPPWRTGRELLTASCVLRI
ncbi:hypothetical protein [Amycolatopsis sp. NBC_01480]|uniref:hypothetical protein n=1 Tax=Amycolatopsis sp. NBC_01480 TaxID=2903562 RepID=UPI002E2B3D92|nr:hypothetical protein [Amycolatopsis sp. NBC_01480]